MYLGHQGGQMDPQKAGGTNCAKACTPTCKAACSEACWGSCIPVANGAAVEDSVGPEEEGLHCPCSVVWGSHKNWWMDAVHWDFRLFVLCASHHEHLCISACSHKPLATNSKQGLCCEFCTVWADKCVVCAGVHLASPPPPFWAPSAQQTHPSNPPPPLNGCVLNVR